MRIKDYVETIFSQAVALEQNSRSKNVICCKGNKVFIINADSTLLLCFKLQEKVFEDDICFYANDYESNKFEEKSSKIVFYTDNEDYEKKKSCNVPDLSFSDVEKLYEDLKEKTEKVNKITVKSSVRELLEENLSHVELVFEKGDWEILQRDIFTGSMLSIKKKNEKGIFDVDEDTVHENIGAIGLRTGDLIGLFALTSVIDFYVYDNGYCFMKSKQNKMTGFVAGCLYDDLGTINYIKKEKTNGRKKQKNRKRKSETD